MEDKIEIVKDILKDKNVAIGFSGGTDSTLIAYLSSKVAKNTLVITIDNNLMPTNFIEYSKKVCERFGIKQKIININFYEDKDFIKNSPDRCYNCRNLMYSQIKNVAIKNGFDYICDGNNISDLVADRPGILITYDNEFETPLIEARLTSRDIHEYLSKNNIPYSRSTTCLATRIQTNSPITPDKIKRISACEDYILSNTDCEIVKVRDLNEIGICEVDNVGEIFNENKFKRINDELKGHGFKKVALNLTPIDDNEYISLDLSKDSFTYQLPFTIDIENTEKQLFEKIINKSQGKIELKNFEIHENGLIKGKKFKNYENALDNFMELLPKLRRNI